MSRFDTMNTISQVLELRRSNTVFKAALCFTRSSLDGLQQLPQDYLHSKEIQYVQSIENFPKRKLNYLLGRYCSKEAIKTLEPEIPKESIFIESGIFQHPIVHYPGHNKLQVSISHSDPLGVAIAFPEAHPMGIDLEEIQIEIDKIKAIEEQLTSEEVKIINSSLEQETEMYYLLFWAIKEALSKILRTGLMTPAHVYEITSLSFNQDHWVSYFKNFEQYKAISFKLSNWVCSIALPKNTECNIDVLDIQKWISDGVKSGV